MHHLCIVGIFGVLVLTLSLTPASWPAVIEVLQSTTLWAASQASALSNAPLTRCTHMTRRCVSLPADARDWQASTNGPWRRKKHNVVTGSWSRTGQRRHKECGCDPHGTHLLVFLVAPVPQPAEPVFGVFHVVLCHFLVMFHGLLVMLHRLVHRLLGTLPPCLAVTVLQNTPKMGMTICSDIASRTGHRAPFPPCLACNQKQRSPGQFGVTGDHRH